MKDKALMVPAVAGERRLGARRHGILIASMLALFAGGCGASSSDGNPPPPTAVIGFDSFLVDVGQRFQLNASSSLDNNGTPIGDDGAAQVFFQWTVIHPTVTVEFDERCEQDPQKTCTMNDDDHCSLDDMDFCHTNADCDTPDDVCLTNSGTTSAECSEGEEDGGICQLGSANLFEFASFVAEAPGPYDVRLLAETGTANSIDVGVIDTYPSLYLVGSLFQLGGTLGGVVGELADGETFAPGAVRGVASPHTGNFLLADPTLGAVREFDVVTGSVIGTFGETGIVDAPVALAFDAAGSLYVADASGTVRRFSGASGLSQGLFADVTAAGEAVTSILFSPNGELLVVDGQAGRALRRYGSNGGSLGDLGTTGAAVGVATDAAFLGSTTLLIADGTGDLVSCDADGAVCAPFGTAAAMLAGGIPSAVDVNPAGSASTAEVLVADSFMDRVVGCNADGTACDVFGDSAGLASAYSDIFFAPPAAPTTTSTTSTTTTTVIVAP